MSAMVGTYELNYLILKSQETPVVGRLELAQSISNAYPYQQFLELRRFGTKIGKQIGDNDFFWKIFEHANKSVFYGNFEKYFYNFIYAFMAADIYSAGFYISYKDGIYHKMTSLNQVENIVTNRLEVSLNDELI